LLAVLEVVPSLVTTLVHLVPGLGIPRPDE
jgi:hypothetical protein